MRRHRGLRALLALLLAVVVYNACIMLANNVIAWNMERALRAYPVPEQTEALASGNAVGRPTSSGNGMQWRGLLAVKSGLPPAELAAHYEPLVREYTPGTAEISVYAMPDVPEGCDLGPTAAGADWQIELWRDVAVGCEENVWEALLNGDLRAH